MIRFRQELSVIPGAVWVIAVVLYLALVVCLFAVPFRVGPKMSLWETWAKVAFGLFIPLMVAIYVLLLGYVYADAKRRGMRYMMWTLLSLFIPNAIGFILYFLLRDPLTQCPRCGGMTRLGFAFCTRCGAALTRSCPQCGHAVEASWLHCAHCGAVLKTALEPAM